MSPEMTSELCHVKKKKKSLGNLSSNGVVDLRKAQRETEEEKSVCRGQVSSETKLMNSDGNSDNMNSGKTQRGIQEWKENRVCGGQVYHVLISELCDVNRVPRKLIFEVWYELRENREKWKENKCLQRSSVPCPDFWVVWRAKNASETYFWTVMWTQEEKQREMEENRGVTEV